MVWDMVLDMVLDMILDMVFKSSGNALMILLWLGIWCSSEAKPQVGPGVFDVENWAYFR